jgi:hypothetical protein
MRTRSQQIIRTLNRKPSKGQLNSMHYLLGFFFVLHCSCLWAVGTAYVSVATRNYERKLYVANIPSTAWKFWMLVPSFLQQNPTEIET